MELSEKTTSPPELHARLARIAAQKGTSFDQDFDRIRTIHHTERR